jgi:hypothetical protein
VAHRADAFDDAAQGSQRLASAAARLAGRRVDAAGAILGAGRVRAARARGGRVDGEGGEHAGLPGVASPAIMSVRAGGDASVRGYAARRAAAPGNRTAPS